MKLKIRKPDDFHVHVRQGPRLKDYVIQEARYFNRALIMPNTLPPVTTPEMIDTYRSEILGILSENDPDHIMIGFTPLMTFKLLSGMQGELIHACAQAGAIAGKYYPQGSTTNASDGPSNPEDIHEALDAMEEAGLVLSIHGEEPSSPVMERELCFLPTVEYILGRWPRLKVVLEHLSTKEAVEFVQKGPDQLAGTITAHHLLFTIDDMIGESMKPGLFCKPVLKTGADREALRNAVCSGSPKFFFGSDSAPHPIEAKRKGAAPAGIYSAPTAVGVLVEVFRNLGSFAELEKFWSKNGAAFYGLPIKEDYIELTQEDWIVPEEMDGAIPLGSGAILSWKL